MLTRVIGVAKFWVVACLMLGGLCACNPRFAPSPEQPPSSLQSTSVVLDKKGNAPKYTENQALPQQTVIDHIVVYKSERRMAVYAAGVYLKSYPIALGRSPVGHKQQEGDMRTPEGRYVINERNPHSDYHKNLGISYPNAQDLAHAKRLGVSAGGAIKIHGLPNGQGALGKLHRQRDWTYGCIAVTNEEMDELYRSVKTNASIELLP